MISSQLDIYNDTLVRCGNIRRADNSPDAPKRCCLQIPFSALGPTQTECQAETIWHIWNQTSSLYSKVVVTSTEGLLGIGATVNMV